MALITRLCKDAKLHSKLQKSGDLCIALQPLIHLSAESAGELLNQY